MKKLAGSSGKHVELSAFQQAPEITADPSQGVSDPPREDSTTADDRPRVDAVSGGSTLTFDGVVVGRRRQHRLDLELVRGSITDVGARAVVLGIFQNVTPMGSGPAAAFDRLLDGAVSQFIERRMFSANTGDIFILPTGTHPVRAQFVLFAGLGSVEHFDAEPQVLVATNVIRSLIHAGIDEFATLLFGSGSGMQVGETLANLLNGFVDGLLEADHHHHFRRVIVCEYDEDRYEAMKRELYRLASTTLFNDIEVTITERPAATMPLVAAPVAPADRDVSTPEPFYLTVRQANSPDTDEYVFDTTMLTAGSKAAIVRNRHACRKAELDSLLESLATSRRLALEDFGTRLAKLLLHADTRQLLADSSLRNAPMVIAHDFETSRIPWETIRLDTLAPAIEGGITRQYMAENLTIAKWLERRRIGAELDVLLIVNPTGDLKGAQNEGQIAYDTLTKLPLVRVTKVEGQEATKNRLLELFRSGEFDVIHYAGHAFFDPFDRQRSGLITAGRQVISGADLAGLDRLPALVFFNACESGRLRGLKALLRDGLAGDDLLRKVQGSPQAQVSFAESFLRGGVANFVGTYWPVQDQAAALFARSMYSAIVDGAPMGQAMLRARRALRAEKLNDWANYMFYGSPKFRLKYRSDQPAPSA